MYLQSILHMVTELRTSIEESLETECHILIQSHSKDIITIEVIIPKHNVNFSKTYHAKDIACAQFPITAMDTLKKQARKALGEAIIK